MPYAFIQYNKGNVSTLAFRSKWIIRVKSGTHLYNTLDLLKQKPLFLLRKLKNQFVFLCVKIVWFTWVRLNLKDLEEAFLCSLKCDVFYFSITNQFSIWLTIFFRANDNTCQKSFILICVMYLCVIKQFIKNK